MKPGTKIETNLFILILLVMGSCAGDNQNNAGSIDTQLPLGILEACLRQCHT